MTLSRVDNWESKFVAVLEHYGREPFEFGRTDCACLAADCIEAITGTDVMEWWRGRYASRHAAAARLVSRGYRSVCEAVDSALSLHNCEPIPPWAARVGDIGLTADGICCVRAPAGFVARDEGRRLYVVEAVRAWAVG